MEINEVNKELKSNLENNINSLKFEILNIKNNVLINPLMKSILIIIYIIGYIIFIPILLVAGSNPYDYHFGLDDLIGVLLSCLLWPYLLIEILKAFIS